MDRRVTRTKKGRDGNIVALCNPGQAWSPRKTSDVIKDIGANKQSYYVQQAEKRTYVRLREGALETTSDTTNENHLGALPSV